MGLVFCLTGFVLAFTLYGDMKQTAEEMYTALPSTSAEPVKVTAKEPFSLLLLGVDERGADAGRSDTMVVLTVNPTLETTKMLSIPRDTRTEIIGKGIDDKINHAYAFGGADMSVKTVEHLLAIPIDYVVRVNMESFVEMIDVVGGVAVRNALDFDYEGESFKRGDLMLDGERALKYVRMRFEDPEGDFGRQNRQKQVIEGVLKESLSLTTVRDYRKVLRILETHVEMNITFEELLRIRKNYRTSFQTLEQLYMKAGEGEILRGIYYYMPDQEELHGIQAVLQAHLEL